MPDVPAWIARARRHAETARELDEIAEMVDEDHPAVIWPPLYGARANHFAEVAARLRALAERERQERDRLMQLQERA